MASSLRTTVFEILADHECHVGVGREGDALAATPETSISSKYFEIFLGDERTMEFAVRPRIGWQDSSIDNYETLPNRHYNAELHASPSLVQVYHAATAACAPPGGYFIPHSITDASRFRTTHPGCVSLI